MINGPDLSQRPLGDSCRLRRARGPRKTWVANNGQTVELPVVVDHVHIDPVTGVCTSLIEAKVDLITNSPQLVDVQVKGYPHINPVWLQRFFRWSTPLDVVQLTVPALLEQGIDPFEYAYPTDGYPDVAEPDRKVTTTLSEEFLEELARQYLSIGRGYAKIIAQQRGVSQRTVVSWIQKARRRGILSATTPGRRSDEIVPAERRNPGHST